MKETFWELAAKIGQPANDPGKPESLSNRAVGRWRALSGRLAGLLWPARCFSCGLPGSMLCAACVESLPAQVAACPCCARPLPRAQLCGACLRRPPPFAATVAVYPYAFPAREMILAFKNGARFELARPLGEALVACAAGLRVDCVLPMPLHPQRLRERGFNQAHELARWVVRAHGWPLWSEAVVRCREHGHGLSALARRRLVRGAFESRRSFRGLRVLVVDDVMTSGATLAELARCLRAAGAREVVNLVVARTELAGKK